MIAAALRQVLGLFVDDEFLGAAILAVTAVASALALSGAPAWCAGLFLTLALPTALAASVVTAVRRARSKKG